ncbi:hypothetical protein I2750_13625 [Bacillus sp. PR5]|nr:hypothetical protein [Bacillus sp. PR5]MCU5081627.1 hypothetical protein [Bacillus cereus]MEB9973483.1 hypothetical protein [Bacillus cereus]
MTMYTLLAAIVAAISSLYAVRKTKELGEKNIEILEKRMLIDTVSAQRIEWINNIRKDFVEFNSSCHNFSLKMIQIDRQGNKGDISAEDYLIIEKHKNQIELSLNPSEIFTAKLIEWLQMMYDGLVNEPQNLAKYNEARKFIIFLQQVILKAEWQRIKRETEKGRQLNEKEVEDVFKITAVHINNKLYVDLITYRHP